MAAPEQYRYLAQLLGARSENEQLTQEVFARILSDYAYWRRNYFPGDEFILTPSLRRAYEEEAERLIETTDRALASLRRSFPFHSPRYIAHQQSETTLPAMFGLVAGMLYNTNTVTPESGAVTVEWEIEACAALARMLGYNPPPSPPETHTQDAMKEYAAALSKEFAWTHLTSGGTVANIEALWVARLVKYFPLAVRDAARSADVELLVKVGAGEKVDIRDLDKFEAIGLRPNESIYLLAKFVEALRRKDGVSLPEASKQAWSSLKASPYSHSKGLHRAASEFEPIVFVTGAAHYSIKKACDVLGIGPEAVRTVPMDDRFRMRIDKLEEQINRALESRQAILAVVSMAGTTEVGAVDPADQILRLRNTMEAERQQSFWVHIDAAWGGFIRSVFVNPSEQHVSRAVPGDVVRHRLFDIGRQIAMPLDDLDTLNEPTDAGYVRRWIEAYLESHFGGQGSAEDAAWARKRLEMAVAKSEASGDFSDLLTTIKRVHAQLVQKGLSTSTLKSDAFKISDLDMIAQVKAVTRDDMSVTHAGETLHSFAISWPTDDAIGRAFLAMRDADSITVDPHKMGYAPYPAGAVAFKNDRVRHLVHQRAPYITRQRGAEGGDALVHTPLRHAEFSGEPDGGPVKTTTAAPSPFTLEGSRPGSAAAALWLASKAMPFDSASHGQIVRSSLLAARALYERIDRWGEVVQAKNLNEPFELANLSPERPDTNLVVFGVRDKADQSLDGYNALNQAIYRKFSIQSELGERRHSYVQPFFLSSTTLTSDDYEFEAVTGYFKRIGLTCDRANYREKGVFLFRASVGNPYIWPALKLGRCDYLENFLAAFTAAARQELKQPRLRSS